MTEFIYEKSNALTSNYCDNLIIYFENNKYKHKNATNTQYKITCVNEMTIESNSKNTIESNIYDNLLIEINANIKIYQKKTIYQNQNQNICNQYFYIQKYFVNSGFDEWHNDFLTIGQKQRMFTYIWFLNDISVGGEILFFNNYHIVPEKGKLIIFPSEWFFSYTNKKPVSDNKYIVIGHLYYDV